MFRKIFTKELNNKQISNIVTATQLITLEVLKKDFNFSQNGLDKFSKKCCETVEKYQNDYRKD